MWRYTSEKRAVWPHRFRQIQGMDIDALEEIIDWCRENFTSSAWMWSAYTLSFYFQDEATAFAFRMRWC